MNYVVQIVKDETGEVVKEINAGPSHARAERIENGVLINLNHADYSTRIIEKEPAQ